MNLIKNILHSRVLMLVFFIICMIGWIVVIKNVLKG
jgi:hypothetical protein